MLWRHFYASPKLMLISDNAVGVFHYTLKNAAGEILDSSSGGDPLAYLQGFGNIVPGLEREMAGKQAGDKFNVVIEPADGYGVKNDELLRVVPKSAFPTDIELEVGMQFGSQTPQGPMAIVISKINGDEITIDGNHPLAGVALHFDIEIVSVRKASAEEIEHGHVHGPGGHHH
jgi:FKBP-type peptidyl-prolyl cis-trans isomerase SlyD